VVAPRGPFGNDRPDAPGTPRRATARDTAEILGAVLFPTVGLGMIKRRPRAMRLAQRADVHRAAIERLRRLRERHAAAPVLLPVPGQSIVLPLSSADVARLLNETPATFSPASSESGTRLSRFQPHGLVTSEQPEQTVRREFTQAVLESGRDTHHLADRVTAVAQEEAERLLASGDQLDWNAYNIAWWRMVRRVALGDQAEDDTALTGMLDRLRLDANWMYIHPRRRRLRRRFRFALAKYLDRAEPSSLAEVVARAAGAGHRAAAINPTSQVAHWLFAFGAAGLVTFRTLALLASHSEQAARVRDELAGHETAPGRYLRACLVDTVRLWPTTPIVLRESNQDTQWGSGILPAGSHFLIFTPFFHRDRDTVPDADRFAPEQWLDKSTDAEHGLVPFSAGPASCPGRNLTLLVSGAILAALLSSREYRLVPPDALRRDRPLPATLDHLGLSFLVRT
jgi:cytochrome P450